MAGVGRSAAAGYTCRTRLRSGRSTKSLVPLTKLIFRSKFWESIIATSLSPDDKLYIDPAKLLPLTRFLPKPKYDNSFSFLLLLLTDHHFVISAC
ncbi:hypothetical protein B296_00007908 [Ensete ventricosum]|uniref:Uncharacterized protein n=1 Tax=Ensete ventricosum TaxID=4639 RepID=A0A427A4Y3_ENSVE|nr:hypothetical protein B296_00007908 [Ensete ventricosum]